MGSYLASLVGRWTRAIVYTSILVIVRLSFTVSHLARAWRLILLIQDNITYGDIHFTITAFSRVSIVCKIVVSPLPLGASVLFLAVLILNFLLRLLLLNIHEV